MAKGDQIIASRTPRADEINIAASLSGESMAAIKFFAPAYDPTVEIREGNRFIGVKTPWFSDTYPDGADQNEFKFYDPANLRNIAGVDGTFDGFDAAQNFMDTNYIPNALKHRDPDDPSKIKILCCDVNQVTRANATVDGFSGLKVHLEKRINQYNHDYLSQDADGNLVSLDAPSVNIFYLLDAEYNVLAVIHAYGFTFLGADKWEIIQSMIYQHDVPINEIVENDNPFYFKTASEVLLPDVIIGDDTDQTASKAGATISDFDLTGSENRLPSGSLANKRTLFLETVEPLNGDVEREEDNVRFDMESPGAALDLNGHTLTLSGDDLRGYLNIVDNGAGKLIISGARSNLRLSLTGVANNALDVSGSEANLEIMSDNNDALNFTGSGSCALNGRLHLRNNAGEEALKVDGDINVGGDIAGGGNLSVDGNLTAIDINAGRNLTVNNDATVGGQLTSESLQLLNSDGPNALLDAQTMLLHFRTMRNMVEGGVWLSDDAHIEIDDYNSDDLNFYEDEDFCFLVVFRTVKDHSQGAGYLLNKGLSDGGRYSLFIDSDNRLVAELKDTGSTSVSVKSDSGKIINDDRTHAALLRCDRKGQIIMYLDGLAQTDVKNDTSKSLWNNKHLYLGQDGSNSGHFQGELLTTRLWNRLLSTEEAVEYSFNPSATLGCADKAAKEYNTINLHPLGAYGGENDQIVRDGWGQVSLYATCWHTLATKGSYGARLHNRARYDGGLTSGSRLYRNVNDWLKPPHRYRLKFDWRHFENGGDFSCELGWDNTGNEQGIATIGTSQNCVVSGKDVEGARIIRSGQSAVNSVTSYPSGTYGVTPLTRVSVEFELTPPSEPAKKDKYLVFRERKGDADSYGSIFLDTISCRSLGCCLDLTGRTLNSASSSWTDSSANSRNCLFKGVVKPQPF